MKTANWRGVWEIRTRDRLLRPVQLTHWHCRCWWTAEEVDGGLSLALRSVHGHNHNRNVVWSARLLLFLLERRLPVHRWWGPSALQVEHLIGQDFVANVFKPVTRRRASSPTQKPGEEGARCTLPTDWTVSLPRTVAGSLSTPTPLAMSCLTRRNLA